MRNVVALVAIAGVVQFMEKYNAMVNKDGELL